MIRKGLPLLALVMIGGCGSSNSDSPASAVSANSPETAATSTQQAPVNASGQTPATTSATAPATVPAPTPDPSNPPAQAPAAAATVSGAIVFAAVKSGIADNPGDRTPYSSGCRQVVSTPATTVPTPALPDPATPDATAPAASTTDAVAPAPAAQTPATTPAAPAPATTTPVATIPTSFFLCGAMRTYQVSGGFPGASGIGATAVVAVDPIVNGDTIFGVTANGLRLDGPAVDLSKIDPQIDSTVGTWKADSSVANLVVMSVAGKPEQMRVCWNLNLPPPAPITGPAGFDPIVRNEPFKRLMCGVYNRLAAGADKGGYVVDDIGGKLSVSEGSW